MPAGSATPFVPRALIETAREQAGCDLNLDELAIAGLVTLSADLAALAPELSFLGKKLLQSAVVETLVKRARVDRLFDQHPDFQSRAIVRPIFIVAPFRTGTTLLHRLLAEDPRLRWTATWEVSLAPPLRPWPPPDSGTFEQDPRIPRVEDYLRRTARLSPELSRLHPTGTQLPEECFGLLEPSLLSPSFLFWAPLQRYLGWLDERGESDWDQAYALYARYLRQLDALRSGGRWLLKSPVHMWGMGALLRVFPDARVVQLHRPAETVVRSFAALVTAHHKLYFRSLDSVRIARLASDVMAQGLARAVAARRAAASEQFIDLSFEMLTLDPLAVVRDLYPRLDLELDPETEARMSAWIRENHSDTRSRPGSRGEVRALLSVYPREIFGDYDRIAYPSGDRKAIG